MFVTQSSTPWTHITPLLQARPTDLGQTIASRLLHLRSLTGGLRHARSGITYVLDALSRWDDSEWTLVEDTVARELSSATMFLAGVLDGLVILDQEGAADRTTSFTRTLFASQQARDIQEGLRELRSIADSGQEAYADFWTLADFWKHYFPYQPRPIRFTRSGVRDFQIQLTTDAKSGPVLKDLIVPVFNGACQICSLLAASVGLDERYLVTQISARS